jgi:hypothetical protein
LRGLDHGQGWGRMWAWALLVAAALPVAARGQVPPERALASESAEPVTLAAHRIQEWTVGQEHWALLEGEAAVLQGVEGVRAQRAVVRMLPLAPWGRSGYRVEIYAEGNARATDQPHKILPSLRRAMITDKTVELQPYESSSRVRANELPKDQALLRRAFPPPTPASSSTAPMPNGIAGAGLPASDANPGQASGKSALVPSEKPKGTGPSQFRHESSLTTTGPSAIAAPPSASPPPKRPQAVPTAPVSTGHTAASSPPGPSPSSVGSALPQAVPQADSEPKVVLDAPISETTPAPAPAAVPRDPAVTRAQFGGTPMPNPPATPYPTPDELDELLSAPPAPSPAFSDENNPQAPATELEPLPVPAPTPLPRPSQPGAAMPGAGPQRPSAAEPPIVSPVLPGTQRILSIYSRDGNPLRPITLETTPDGVTTTVIRGGVTIIADIVPKDPEHPENDPVHGTIDVSADNVVIWRRDDPQKKTVTTIGPNGELIQDARQPLEMYLEGNVIFRQDERLVAGNGDQTVYKAQRAYYNFNTDRLIALDAEVNLYAPGLLSPFRSMSPQIDQFRPLQTAPDGTPVLGPKRIYSNRALATGSRFGDPGYSITSRSSDMIQVPSRLIDPTTNRPVGDSNDPNAPKDFTWQIDTRQNFFWIGGFPAFYWPRLVATPENLDPPLYGISYRYNNYNGNQILTYWNGFKLFGLRKPKNIDYWNVDIDELTVRGPALGTELGWFGENPIPNYVKGKYAGYISMWGIIDHGLDVLGSGPQPVTWNVPEIFRKGPHTFQRISEPPPTPNRGRLVARNDMGFLDPAEENPYEDFRLQTEVGYISDRNLLEEYYKWLFDTGHDQETLAFLWKQRENTQWSIQTEANLQNWYTDTQWLPKFDYTRLGDSLLGNRLLYFTDNGADWANTHTAVEVNNPNIFAFLPFDPVSNTSNPFETGRIWTTHELDLPFNFQVARVVPYVQGQFVGWNNQYQFMDPYLVRGFRPQGAHVGRVWGAAGARADVMLWRAFPNVESELLNIHGLNHKINFDVDFRSAYSNVHLDQLGIQDDLDDNTYEYVRRYFALINYANGALPLQYDPRHLILRRTLSPLTTTTDVQGSMETLQMAIHQRLQTKRGPEGKRRIIDWMIFDVSTTYFPNASRDNFGKPWGQNMYNWEWYIGDRTSLISYGWFEFFKVWGTPLLQSNPKHANSYPFGLAVVNSGISISRPPRGNLYIGYSVINSGVIATSAINAMFSYWLSPKWYGTFATSYDFGNAIGLGSLFSFTRVGADFLTSVGMTFNPLRNTTVFSLEIVPRLSPNFRLGSNGGLPRFDSRFAATQ